MCQFSIMFLKLNWGNSKHLKRLKQIVQIISKYKKWEVQENVIQNTHGNVKSAA